MVDVLRGEDGNVVGRGQFRHGVEPEILLGIVHVREDGRNLDPVPQQRLDAHAADVVIGQNHCSHFRTSDSDWTGILRSLDSLPANNLMNEIAGPRPHVMVDATDVLPEQPHGDKLGADEDEKDGKQREDALGRPFGPVDQPHDQAGRRPTPRPTST